MPDPDKIILSHQGALGDFLCAWPSLASLAAWRPDIPRYFEGSAEYLDFLKPLGVETLPLELRKPLHDFYYLNARPEMLGQAVIARFGLNKRPELTASGNLWYLLGLDEEGTHPRQAYLNKLAKLGVPELVGWKEIFRKNFSNPRPDSKRALIFPGAGHPAKAWPLVKFFELASWLESKGFEPFFALGPAELERGVSVRGWPCASPASLSGLCDLINSACLAVGNDSGPLHLSGMLGMPGLALFGPVSPRLWGPLDTRCLSLNLACSPCTSLTRELDCPHPRCLSDLPLDSVTQALGALLVSGKRS